MANWFVNFLAFIGLLLILGWSIRTIGKIISNRRTDMIISNIYPPGDYMMATGIKCPDYWVYVGNDAKGNYICRNSFDIDTRPKEKNQKIEGCKNVRCYSNPNDKEVIFASLDKMGSDLTWDYKSKEGLTSMTEDQRIDFVKNFKPQDVFEVNDEGENVSVGTSRCDWMKCCGPYMGENSQSDAVWLGVNDYCGRSTES